ncbi:hypothetical protein PTTG_01653 [Puccinia triticina 1-1 BBBD Race 1]|uniref:Chitin synthase export chaperone n=2 Tax=Puccinia triticina TaxID=208348 RepID=A0A180GM30_PUCT1|nr:uncharacterized protein PtA15_16A273 [Puccinia triticina]OAV93836.1 hypothetical protein PTTG_01653 [Puccinia triticina 1-1 BBBD Race 1]WAQ92366.1 hypothetical protein PtA15_16A273 [Puccinia triticina]WAR64101.1 hypothetical protein PtB15_16B261 [Puccinia triticina]
MVAFKYGEWDYICRVSPQPICSLFFRQLLVHPDRGEQAAPDAYLQLPAADPTAREAALRELGLGIRAPCAIPRMESVGGKPDALGNAANIVACCLSLFVVAGFIRKAFRRKAAVARVEILILLGLYGLLKFFEIFATGAFLEQGARAVVWLTALHLALVVCFFGALVWLGFLGLQLVEDGTPLSLGPLAASLAFLFIGSIYIFLDTGFGVTHYFSSQPASHLYSPWTFSLVILWPLIALTIYGGLTVLVAVRILGELKPVIVVLCSLMTLGLGEIFRWVLTQPICHSSDATVDGSFVASLLELGALGLVVYNWTCLTEAEWEEYNDLGFAFPPAHPLPMAQHPSRPPSLNTAPPQDPSYPPNHAYNPDPYRPQSHFQQNPHHVLEPSGDQQGPLVTNAFASQPASHLAYDPKT